MTKQQTVLAITSSGYLATGSVNVSASLTEDGKTPIANRTVTFAAGTISATGVTNASGVASATLPLSSGQYTSSASFAGDNYYVPANTTQAICAYQNTQFVIWGGNLPNLADIQAGRDYYFWGSQW